MREWVKNIRRSIFLHFLLQGGGIVLHEADNCVLLSEDVYHFYSSTVIASGKRHPFLVNKKVSALFLCGAGLPYKSQKDNVRKLQ